MDLPLVLHINLEKSEVVWQSSNVVNDIFSPQHTGHHIAEFDILGSPIGSSIILLISYRGNCSISGEFCLQIYLRIPQLF